jgi:predicted transcriptional regulator
LIDPILEIETRRRIFEAVCKFPGIHMRELSREVQLQKNLVDYHLEYLEKNDVIRSESDGQFKRYFSLQAPESQVAGAVVSASDKGTIMLLRQPVPFRIVVLLARRGCISHKDLSKALRKSPATMSHHLDKLVRAGVVSPNPDGRGYVLADEKKIARILMSFTPMPSLLANGFIDMWEDLRLFNSKEPRQ